VEFGWSGLRKKQLGPRFKRQAILRGYVADFYCPRVKLVVEVDGPSHAGNQACDTRRDNDLARLGILTIRFTNTQVFDALEQVLSKIRTTIDDRLKAGVQPFRPMAKHKNGAWLEAKAARTQP
jgi:very-short-patch-repair endonuclease